MVIAVVAVPGVFVVVSFFQAYVIFSLVTTTQAQFCYRFEGLLRLYFLLTDISEYSWNPVMAHLLKLSFLVSLLLLQIHPVL